LLAAASALKSDRGQSYKRRGLNVRPELAIADGPPGFWKAAGEIWPTTREKRCRT
jgi:hypothetical protein